MMILRVEESDSDSEEKLKTRKKSRRAQEESESEESEEEEKQGRRKATRKKKDVSKDEEETRKEVQSKVVDVDVDGIIRQIQGLKVDNSKYTVCYFKLLDVKLAVAQLLPFLFQHMHNVLVQQAATYPNSILVPAQCPCSSNCHFRIGNCEVIFEYIKAGCVIQEGRMVLYADRSPIAWNAQGLKISVDFCFKGPLPAQETVETTLETERQHTTSPGTRQQFFPAVHCLQCQLYAKGDKASSHSQQGY
jgi:hypothetical protein